MPGSPVFHGYATTNVNQGVGGAARVESSSLNTGNPSDMTFFFWVALLGIGIPILLIGGLQIGGFSFVFRKG